MSRYLSSCLIKNDSITKSELFREYNSEKKRFLEHLKNALIIQQQSRGIFFLKHEQKTYLRKEFFLYEEMPASWVFSHTYNFASDPFHISVILTVRQQGVGKIKGTVSRDEYISKAYNNRQVLFVHALMILTIFCSQLMKNSNTKFIRL